MVTHAIKQCVQPQRGVILVKGSICTVILPILRPDGAVWIVRYVNYQYSAPLVRFELAIRIDFDRTGWILSKY